MQAREDDRKRNAKVSPQTFIFIIYVQTEVFTVALYYTRRFSDR
jgi:hypothetical protein